MSKNTGEIIQVVGVVVDAEFGKDLLPAINDAMKVKVGDHEVTSDPEHRQRPHDGEHAEHRGHRAHETDSEPTRGTRVVVLHEVEDD